MKNKNFTITIAPSKKKCHTPRRSGAGVHQDRRTRRQRTRNEQTRRAIQQD